MTILPLAERKAKYKYIVRKSTFPDSAVKMLPASAYVFDVIKGGASDRAGMKVGDLIVKINGQDFENIWQADHAQRQSRQNN